ncbi:hypothetical protein [Candidatus Solirubrobacter pratensis]|uniref:hypothetical protein n=1 Tax=Candidatus Solirubrobacter pratensis TaxID=1298857 RepID=UPI00047F4F98|nr:hypothetical protein [Candidatus Solirubrobacter pratensis]
MAPEQIPVSTLNNVDTSPEGQVAGSAQEAATLQQAGFEKCYNPVCDYHIHPDRLATHDEYDAFTCPSCRKTYNLLDPAPFAQGRFTPGGRTIVGLSPTEQGRLAENIVKGLGEIPGYGPITWWSDIYNSPLDGGTAEWGIEVKAVAVDAKNHRFIAGRPSEKASKNETAAKMGYKGVLGILVMLDYRRSVADIYVKEMPLAGVTIGGRRFEGIFAYRAHTVPKLIEEVPFRNPFLEPDHPSPTVQDAPDADDAINHF